ncbi:MAG: zinc-ribbon domain-containing protein [Oscillospiraceae bacterium]|nr:zinc-ribbon domain-containing protein [Oscillospiraceae bacterium]
MICTNCGAKIAEGGKFCIKCGTAVVYQCPQSETAPPEGFIYDAESALYYIITPGFDPRTGQNGNWTTWFRPDTGEYYQHFEAKADEPQRRDQIPGGKRVLKRNPRKKIVILAVCAALVFAAIMGLVFLRDGLPGDILPFFGGGDSTGDTEIETPPGNTADAGDDGLTNIIITRNADPAGAKVFNVMMGGTYAFDGERIYHNTGHSVADEAGNILYDEPLYFMSAEAGVLHGVNARGAIIAVDEGANARQIRDPGSPTRLLRDGEALYFIENGLLKISVSGGDETRLLDFEPRSFTVRDGTVFYIGTDGKFWRLDGGTPQLALDIIIGDFCFDGDDLYFTLLGNGDLIRADADDEYTVFEGFLSGMTSARFAVYDGYLYHGDKYVTVLRTSLATGESQSVCARYCAEFYLTPRGVICVSDPPERSDFIAVDEG